MEARDIPEKSSAYHKREVPTRKEKCLPEKRSAYQKREVPTRKEQCLPQKRGAYHKREVPTTKERCLPEKRSAYQKREVLTRKEKCLPEKRSAYQKREAPTTKEKCLPQKRSAYHKREVPTRKGKCLPEKRSAYQKREVPTRKEKCLPEKSSAYHKREAPTTKEKCLPQKRSAYHKREVPTRKEKCLPEREVPTRKEKCLPQKRSAYQKREVPTRKEKCLPQKRRAYQKREAPHVCTLNAAGTRGTVCPFDTSTGVERIHYRGHCETPAFATSAQPGLDLFSPSSSLSFQKQTILSTPVDVSTGQAIPRAPAAFKVQASKTKAEVGESRAPESARGMEARDLEEKLRNKRAVPTRFGLRSSVSFVEILGARVVLGLEEGGTEVPRYQGTKVPLPGVYLPSVAILRVLRGDPYCPSWRSSKPGLRSSVSFVEIHDARVVLGLEEGRGDPQSASWRSMVSVVEIFEARVEILCAGLSSSEIGLSSA
ncbi:hypothetical protein PRIPAC_98051 [Pristionchus pacificus]|uniref:Uncharacterized protein n=1 Tax=Pristionchus pacificus TaxID=54126 RepID=A0A2A6BD94_PRIPA|nr:hypothetical protein PRIPAC_98051 [Pristionchus pacificus]|eukprot:PDM63816.1 hypothetical protein PRIPAC_49789 [Pristionchus pacificus]